MKTLFATFVLALTLVPAIAFADSYQYRWQYNPYTGEYQKIEVYIENSNPYKQPTKHTQYTSTSPRGTYQSNSSSNRNGYQYNYNYNYWY